MSRRIDRYANRKIGRYSFAMAACFAVMVGITASGASAEEYGTSTYGGDILQQNEFQHESASSKRTRKIPPWIPILHESEIFVDLVFLVDGSGSVTQENFSLAMDWIGDVSRAFDISTGKLQIGVVQYSHWYRFRAPENQKLMKTEIALGECRDRDCLDKKLNSIKLMGFTSYTGFAINKTVNEDFANSVNANTSWKILVLLTDGPSQDGIFYSANYARSKNVTIFCVGVGAYALYELQLIANGEEGNNLMIYPMGGFSDLPDIVGSLQSEIKSIYLHVVCPPLNFFHGVVSCDDLNNVGSKCQFSCDAEEDLVLFGSVSRRCKITPHGIVWGGAPSTCGICDAKFDLLIVIVSSPNASSENFAILKEFLQDIIGALPIASDRVQVSCVTHINSTVDEFEYNDYKTKESLITAVENIGRERTGMVTGTVFRYAVENKFHLETGRRDSVPHITLIITDESLNDESSADISRLKQLSRVIAISLNEAELNPLNQTHQAISTLPGYQELRNSMTVWNTVNNLCDSVDIVKKTICEPLEGPEASSVNCSGGISGEEFGNVVATECSLHCPLGYRAIGNPRAFCDYHGKWIKENWNCVEKDCTELSRGDGVLLMRCPDTKIGSTCRSGCRPGYEDIQTEFNMEWRENMETHAEYIHTCTREAGKDPRWIPEGITCQKKDICPNATCSHGICVENGNGFKCQCDSGYAGMFCLRDVNECQSNPCLNDGKCRNKVDRFECICDSGFEGERCEIDSDECVSNPCKNEGECINLPGTFTCKCTAGYNGTYCGENIDDCLPDPCKNGAKCKDGVNSFSCECPERYYGTYCQNPKSPCSFYPCGRNNICTSEDNETYSCTCPPGYAGDQCETIIRYCDLPGNNCSGQGKCIDIMTGFKCECDYGYIGRHCEADIDYCEIHSCKNRATCKPCKSLETCENTKLNYTCECRKGYNGTFCEEVCTPDPCQPHGSCLRKPDSLFTCNCLPGYMGQFCEVYHNECDMKPCQNGGVCSLVSHTYSCNCTEGYMGVNCTEDVDECSKEPPICKNGASCNNTFGGFNCTCQKGYWGKVCDEELCFLPKSSDDMGEMTCTNDNKPGSVCVLSCPRTWRVTFRNRKMGIDLTLTCHKNGSMTNVSEEFVAPARRLRWWECEPMYCQLPAPEDAGPVDYVRIENHDSDLVGESIHEISCTNGSRVDSVCNLTCHGSFSLKGNRKRICTEQGVWKGLGDVGTDEWRCRQFKCIRPIPKADSHTLNCTDEFEPGSVCDLRCMPNLKYVGRQRSKMCTRDLTWAPNGPWGCEEVTCRQKLPEIPNGQFFCSEGQRVFSVCKVRCDPGYFLNLEKPVTCQKRRDRSTAWSGLEEHRTCTRSECDFEMDLKTGNHTADHLIPEFVSLQKIPPAPNDQEYEALVAQECDVKAIISINITYSESFTFQLWYGETARGYHTMISTNPDSEGYQPSDDEYALFGISTGNGAEQLLSSGFSDPPVVEFPSTVNMTLDWDEWTWKSSRGQWTGTLLRSPSQNSLDLQQWYEVYFGLNSALQTGFFHETARNAGLCYVCLKRK